MKVKAALKLRALSFVVVVGASLTPNAWAQNIYLAGEGGAYAKLTMQGSNLRIEDVELEALRAELAALSPSTLEDSERSYSTGNTKIINREVYTKARSGWVKSELQAPPNPSITYAEAVLDADKNIFVRLAGTGKGLNYVSSDGNVFVARNLGLTDEFTKILPLKGSTGVIALKRNGELVTVQIDEASGRAITNSIGQNVRDIVELGKHQVAVTHNGIALVSANGIRSVDVSRLGAEPRLFNVDNGLQRDQLQRLASGVQNGAHRANAGEKPSPIFESLDATNKYVEIFLDTISRNMTDEIALDEFEGKRVKYFGRDIEAEQAIEMLSRTFGPNPVLVGDAGVGKTAIAELLAQRAFYGEFPPALRSMNALNNSVWVETSADLISLLAKSDSANAQAAAVRLFVKSMQEVQRLLDRPLVVFIDEVHMLSEAQINALKPILESKRSPVRFVMSTTNREYGLLVKRDPATERRLPRIDVPEFSAEDTKRLLMESVVPTFEKDYRGLDGQSAVITEAAVDKIIDRTHEVLPNGSFPEGPIKFLMNSITREHLRAAGRAPTLDAPEVSDFVKRALRLPIDPDAPDFEVKIEEAREKLKEIVVDQERLVDSLIDNYSAIVDADRSSKLHRVILVTGVTGAGKTFGAEEAAKLLVGESRHLIIDGTKYANADGNISIVMNDLLGAPPGIISSDQTAGILPEFLAGRGRGFNMITINEADKMDPEAFKRLMEMFDRGELQAADGKTYKLGRSIITLTTNKGSDEIFPRKYVSGMTRAEILARVSQYTVDQIKQFFLKPDPNNLYSHKTLPPEVVQRIDDAVVALPPSREAVEKKILVNELRKRSKGLKAHKGITMDFTEEAMRKIADTSYDPINGVRNPKRIVNKLVEFAKSRIRKSQGLAPGDNLIVDVEAVGRTNFKFILRKEQGGEALEVDPRELSLVVKTDPFEDPEVRELLLSLEAKLNTEVFGQEDMIKRVTEVIMNQRANNQVKQPVAALLAGTTGTGKSELAKAIARQYYGSETRMKPFNMADVKSEIDFNNIFSPPKGIVGSEKIGPFEEFVRAHQTVGGVVLLDEIGNMGGGDPALKKQLLKKFYSIIDEGTWTSPITGEVYDLRNLIFIMTSNEGEELFKDVVADDLRIATWKEANKAEHLEKMLTQDHGWPEALVGRLDLVLMAKPLVQADRVAITNKFLSIFEKYVKGNTPVARVYGNEQFYEQMSRTFFSHTKGARLLRAVIDKGPLSSLFTKARIDLSLDELEGTEFRVELVDTYFGRHYTDDPANEKRSVKFKLVIEKNGEEIRSYESEELAGIASPKRLVTKDSASKTAYHEAGHALVNFFRLTGQKTVFVTIIGEGDYLGYARSERGEFSVNSNRDAAVAQIAMILAGQQAQVHAGVGKDAGWVSDLEKARKIAQRAVTDFGLVDNVYDLPTKDGKVIVEHRKVQAEIAKLLQEGSKFADLMLTQNWHLIEEMRDYLVEHGEIEKADLEALMARVVVPENEIIPTSRIPGYQAPVDGGTRSPASADRCEKIISQL
ncbi:MAG TPA: AAA family ATPase [Bdellovibrionota bacterium]|jgi:ATP-dependent Clp protease ATP-binding subunit ClpC|nr:AAA family ATPase [Bdellovibrionota bacterium]